MLGKCATRQFININQFFVLPTNPALFQYVLRKGPYAISTRGYLERAFRAFRDYGERTANYQS